MKCSSANSLSKSCFLVNHSASAESAISTKGHWSCLSDIREKGRDAPVARSTTYMQGGRSGLLPLPSDSTGRSSGRWSICFTDATIAAPTLPSISPSLLIISSIPDIFVINITSNIINIINPPISLINSPIELKKIYFFNSFTTLSFISTFPLLFIHLIHCSI